MELTKKTKFVNSLMIQVNNINLHASLIDSLILYVCFCIVHHIYKYVVHTHRMNTCTFMLDDLYFPVYVENSTNALKLTASVNDMKIRIYGKTAKEHANKKCYKNDLYVNIH